MRVLFWSAVFWPKVGGVEVHAAKLLPSLRERGCEYLVITAQSDPDQAVEDNYQGIAIHRLPFWDSRSYTQVDSLTRIRHKVAELKLRFAPDLIHINAVSQSDFFYVLTRHVAPAPLLVTLHGEWPPHENGVTRQTLNAADWVAGCSHAILEKGIGLVPDVRSRSSVIHNGVDSSELQPEPLPFESPRLLCLGRLSPEKGIDVAVAAFRCVLEQFPYARLVIAGSGSSQPELERQVAKEGISNRVDFLGWVEHSNVLPLVNSSTLVLIPSREEAFGLVALEAGLMARPVVASRVGGLSEVVTHEETGLLFESENVLALSDSIVSLLRRPHVAVAMGQAGRNRVQQLFSWKHHVDRYEALYRKLTA